LTVKRDGQTSTLYEGETGVVEPGVWHDWWNGSDRDARVRVEATPGERFAHVIETLFGLARLGHTNAKGMPNPLQLALFGQEFSDVVVFRSPPPAVQRMGFAALAPIARWRGYRATYPQLSRTVLARGSDDRRPTALGKGAQRKLVCTRLPARTRLRLREVRTRPGETPPIEAVPA
jgi:hypothetical protein